MRLYNRREGEHRERHLPEPIDQGQCFTCMASIRDNVLHVWRPWGTMFYLYGVHEGQCFTCMASMRDNVLLVWRPSGTMFYLYGVHEGQCFTCMASIRDSGMVSTFSGKSVISVSHLVPGSAVIERFEYKIALALMWD